MGTIGRRLGALLVLALVGWPGAAAAQVSPSPSLIEAGALLSYSSHFPSIFRQAALYTDKLLRRARPADPPLEEPSKFELIVDQKAAAALGIALPPSLLLRADRVIQ